MPTRRLATGIALVLFLNKPAAAEMFKIDNPAANIYNPATQMDNPNPLSPPTQPVSQPTVTEATNTTTSAEQIKELPHPQPQPNNTIPQKSYHFKTVRAYINAAKKAFKQEDYKKFLSITEDAQRRIKAGTLKASKKTKQELIMYQVNGYRLLENTKNNLGNKPNTGQI